MGATADFVFICPACEESMEVNRSMRDALIENGCVVCGSPVSEDAFTAQAEESPDQ